MPNFVEDGNKNADVSKVGGADFLQQLKAELLRLKFYEKNNDLYQFHQVRISYICTVYTNICHAWNLLLWPLKIGCAVAYLGD